MSFVWVKAKKSIPLEGIYKTIAIFFFFLFGLKVHRVQTWKRVLIIPQGLTALNKLWESCQNQMLYLEDCTDIFLKKWHCTSDYFLPNGSGCSGLRMLRDHVRFLKFVTFCTERSSYFFFFKYWCSDIKARYKSRYTRQIFKSPSIWQNWCSILQHRQWCIHVRTMDSTSHRKEAFSIFSKV